MPPPYTRACSIADDRARGGLVQRTINIPRLRMRRWAVARLALASMALASMALAPAPLSAHAELVTSDPEPNASLVDAPDEIRITFSEPIDPGAVFVDLLDTDLATVDGVGPVEVADDGMLAIVPLPPLDPAIYTVSYQVISTVDGHATAGLFAFGVDPSGAQAPPTAAPTSSSPSVDPWAIGFRWLALAAALVAIGSLATWWQAGRRVLAEMAPRADRRPPWRLVGLATGGTVVGLLAYLSTAARPIVDARTNDVGLSLDVVAPFGWTPFAIAMRVALVASLAASVIVLAALARRRRRTTRGDETPAAALVAGCMAVTLAGMSAAGHASSLGGPLAGAIDWLHLGAAAVWLGGLPAIGPLARRASVPGSAAAARAMLRRHGAVALVAGPLVVLTGLTSSPIVVGDARELVASEHGNLLLAKAGLASLALGIGAANHVLLRGRGRANVAMLVGAELVIAALAVMAAAAMVTIQPGASRQPMLTGAPVNPAHLYATAGPSSIHASVSLPAPGNQNYQVTVEDVESGAARPDVQKVFLTFHPPAASDLPQEWVELEERETEGLYGVRGAYTPLVGEWNLEVTVRRTGARDESTSFGLLVVEPSPPRDGPPPDDGIGVPGPIALLWGVLPSGPAGWLPALVAVATVIGSGAIVGARRPRWLTPLRLGLAAVAVVAILGAGSRSVVEAANRPSAADLAAHDPGDLDLSPADGERIYLANCASCHGPNGDGAAPVDTLPVAGDLRQAIATMSDAEVSYRIANGLAGTPMPAFAAVLTEQERWDLVSYLRDRWGSDR